MQSGVAWSYLKMKNKSQAIKYFRGILKVKKNNPNALSGLEILEKGY